MPENLEAIRPIEHHRVMDLAAAAGIDVSGWANFAGGAARAASNPKYCYQWAFVQPDRAVVVNLWHEDMIETGGEVSMTLTSRWRDELTGVRKGRGKKLLSAIDHAAASNVPLRVIVNAGRMTAHDEESGSDKSRVLQRLLDPIPWHVGSFDPTSGACVLYRGPGVGGSTDQFAAVVEDETPERRQVVGSGFVRDAALRQGALDRARGRCEYCACLGFVMPSGKVFLETHHVVPLSEGGLDRAANIVAICANDHREAHLGSRAADIRKTLLEHLANVVAER